VGFPGATVDAQESAAVRALALQHDVLGDLREPAGQTQPLLELPGVPQPLAVRPGLHALHTAPVPLGRVLHGAHGGQECLLLVVLRLLDLDGPLLLDWAHRPFPHRLHPQPVLLRLRLLNIQLRCLTISHL